MLAPRFSCTARSGVARGAAGSVAGSGAPAAASGAAAAGSGAPAAGSAGPGSDVLIGLASKPPAWPALSPRRRGRAQPTEPFRPAPAPVATPAARHGGCLSRCVAALTGRAGLGSGNVTLLSEEEITTALATLRGWTRSGASITRTVELTDFREAMLYTGAVAYLAETANHHPDVLIQWNRV